MTLIETDVDFSASTVAHDWIGRFGSSIDAGDPADLAALIQDKGIWRDLLGFQWEFSNHVGGPAIAAALLVLAVQSAPRSFTLRADKAAVLEEVGDRATVVAFFEFDNKDGHAHGFVRLAQDERGDWQAASLITALDSIDGVRECVGRDRPVHKVHRAVEGRLDWQDQRLIDHEFANRDPQVVVLGAGHCGLAITARLEALGVDSLLLEQHERVGDNWRKRYSSLALHDPTVVDELPYMPYSSRWPEYPSKDKFAGFLEYYADALDLKVWTSSTVKQAVFEVEKQRWTLTVERDGQKRVLRPRHFVIATGLNGLPNIPDLEGADRFRGTTTHSSQYQGGSQWKGKRAVVVGSGVSGHDIAQDLREQGADVTLVQRSSTYVVGMKTFQETFWSAYLSGAHARIDDADLSGAGLPYSLIVDVLRPVVAAMAERDRDLIDGLESKGFATSLGPTGGGAPELHYFASDGFYYNVGASDLIIDGKIAIASGSGVASLTDDAVVLENGTTLRADLVVLATGYGTILEAVRPILGELAQNVPAVYRVGEDGELAGVWRRSGQDGLWFMTGLIQEARFYSKRLALQIAAIENGRLSYSAAGTGGTEID